MKKPYTGILAEPMSGPPSPLDLMERLVALAKHYDVEPLGPNGLALAFELAVDHVPGFQVKPRPPIRGLAGGRKSDVTKDIVILGELFRAEEEGRSVSAAARHLADRCPRVGHNGQNDTSALLQDEIRAKECG